MEQVQIWDPARFPAGNFGPARTWPGRDVSDWVCGRALEVRNGAPG